MRLNSIALVGIVLAAGFAAGWTWLATAPAARAAAAPKKKAVPKPVEDDMHEFMEYVFQPGYKRLKAAMAAEPEDNAGWKVVKAEALTLAEGGNLLLFRQPEEGAADWQGYSIAVRSTGGQLYQAARAKDYDQARGCYTAMLEQCNACHKRFADGKHQLTP